MAAPRFSNARAAQIRARSEGQLSAKGAKSSRDTFTKGTKSPVSSNAARPSILGSVGKGGGVHRDKKGRFT